MFLSIHTLLLMFGIQRSNEIRLSNAVNVNNTLHSQLPALPGKFSQVHIQRTTRSQAVARIGDRSASQQTR